MPSVAYGAAKHFLKDSANAITLTPSQANGNGMTLGTAYVSPLISDISVSIGGTIKEFVDYTGEYAAFEVSGEYADVTFTLIPTGSSKANALLASHQFRNGTPFEISGAPRLKLYGHTPENSPVTDDLLGYNVAGSGKIGFLQSMETRMSLEGETTGTITLRIYFKSSISDAVLT